MERSAACSLRASKLDGMEERWRRLVVHSLVSEDAPFRCSTGCAGEPDAAFYRLTLITPLPPSPQRPCGFGVAGAVGPL
jgi:hypothetical protein